MAALLQQHLADFGAASPGGQPIGIHVDAFGAGVALGCVGRTGPIQLLITAQFDLQAQAAALQLLGQFSSSPCKYLWIRAGLAEHLLNQRNKFLPLGQFPQQLAGVG